MVFFAVYPFSLIGQSGGEWCYSCCTQRLPVSAVARSELNAGNFGALTHFRWGSIRSNVCGKNEKVSGPGHKPLVTWVIGVTVCHCKWPTVSYAPDDSWLRRRYVEIIILTKFLRRSRCCIALCQTTSFVLLTVVKCLFLSCWISVRHTAYDTVDHQILLMILSKRFSMESTTLSCRGLSHI